MDEVALRTKAASALESADQEASAFTAESAAAVAGASTAGSAGTPMEPFAKPRLTTSQACTASLAPASVPVAGAAV